MVFFGNLHPGTVMIDAKPIPGIGQDRGHLLARPRPDANTTAPITRASIRAAARTTGSAARRISRDARLSAIPGRSPKTRSWPPAARASCCSTAQGACAGALPPAAPRNPRPGCSATSRGRSCGAPREPVDPRPQPTRRKPPARLVLADVYQGRNMAGVRRGEIKKLLVLGNAAQADQLHRRHGPAELRRHVHPGAGAGHRAGRAGRLGLLRGAGPAQPCSSSPWTRTTWPSSACRAS